MNIGNILCRITQAASAEKPQRVSECVRVCARYRYARCATHRPPTCRVQAKTQLVIHCLAQLFGRPVRVCVCVLPALRIGIRGQTAVGQEHQREGGYEGWGRGWLVCLG